MLNVTRRATLLASAIAIFEPIASSAFAAPGDTGNLPSGVQFSTYRYATKNGRDLYLDLITDSANPAGGTRPVILYSFGGGWEGGDRGNRESIAMWTDFLSLGYAVVAIDYRLGVQDAKRSGEFTKKNGTQIYLKAIEQSVEDLFDATSFIVAHAEEWNVDAAQIVMLGGSSGATNSLVAEFNVANSTELAQRHLPVGFRYAGVISMAGAFWLKAGTQLAFASKPAPIMFFHGAKDWLVTYDEVQAEFSGYGPAYYFRKYPGPEYPKWFVDYPEGDHVLAALPLITRQLEIRAFLERIVRDRQELSIHTVELSKVPSSLEGIMQKQSSGSDNQ